MIDRVGAQTDHDYQRLFAITNEAQLASWVARKSVCDDESHSVSEVGNLAACRFAANVGAASDVDDQGTNTHGPLGRQVPPPRGFNV